MSQELVLNYEGASLHNECNCNKFVKNWSPLPPRISMEEVPDTPEKERKKQTESLRGFLSGKVIMNRKGLPLPKLMEEGKQ